MSGFLHFDGLERILYTLLSVVNAERSNLQLLSDSEVARCLPHRIFPEPMIEDLIISSAVRIRMIEDRFRVRRQEIWYPYRPDEICRIISGSLRSGDSAKSGLRLASDKIVHAKEVRFYEDGRLDVVYIDGENGKKPWRVEVDVRRFSVAGLCLAAQYEDNWSVSSRDSVTLVVSDE